MADSIRVACVIGWPVAHSRSPLIHGHWIQRHGIKGEYRREPVKPEELDAFIAGFAERGYVGGNVTIPHKEKMVALTEPDDSVRKIGAANTIWFEGGRLQSTNTDFEGFLASLDASAPGWDKNLDNAVVIGAGGAARAVVYGFVQRGVGRIHLVNRTLARAEAFVARFGKTVQPTAWEDLPRVLKGAGLVANTSSLGMTGNPSLEIDLAGIRDDAVVADAVYVPLKTDLILAAEKRRLRVSDGLGMLLHQAGRGFQLWFGVRPTVTPELRKLIEDELLKR
ncbi:MAG: shikimate dehydrogenase [Alphaproteobacteria bacterium]|nr:shikimate dehydrogenase [Alphaproteobacteria bacterium]